MVDLEATQTYENLKAALQLESQQAQLYLYFAKIAEMEGYQHVADLFDNIAEGCLCNSHGHLDVIKHAKDPISNLPMGDTKDNLKAALKAEDYGYREFYTRVAIEAHNEGIHDIASWMETLSKLKGDHKRKLEELSRSLDGGQHEHE